MGVVNGEEPLLVTAFLASPLDGEPAIRCAVEMSALTQALQEAGVMCSIDAVRPPNPSGIATQPSKGILHVACHGSDDGLELQDASGRSVTFSASEFAVAIEQDWKLVVLNGCDTSSAGEHLNAQLETSVVCTSGYVSDEAAEEFTQIFYRHVAAGAPFDTAVSRANHLVNTKWPVSYLYLPGRVDGIQPRPGRSALTFKFKDAVQATLCTQNLAPSRRGLLIDVFHGLSGPLRAARVFGPPQGGVTSLLRAAVDYFSWLTLDRVLWVDARELSRVEELQVKLSDPDAWIVIDNFDEAGVPVRDAVTASLTLPTAGRSRLLLGTHEQQGASSLMDVTLAPLTASETNDFLAGALGPLAANWTWLPGAMEAWPGKLQSMLTHIASGASKDDVMILLAEGDPHSGLESAVDLAWRDPYLRTALCCFAAYPIAPRALCKEAWLRALQLNAETDEEGAFGQVLLRLSRRGLVRIQESILKSGALVAYVSPEPDVLAIVRRKRTGTLTPAQRTRILDVMLSGLEGAQQSASLDANADWLWVTNVLRACRENAVQEERALSAIFPHLDRGGDMLRAGDASKHRMIVDAAYDLARHIGSWDEAAQLALVQGQMRYQSGDLIGAEKEFNKILRMQVSASRKLQAYRARGQISYRRGDYRDALRDYERARHYAAEADRFVVTTLLQESGKALSRMGRGPEAVAMLREVLLRRAQEDGVREVAKAEHELARALLRVKELPEARALFESARSASLAVGDERWSLGPLYHLFLIELNSDNLPKARSKLSELGSMAGKLNEKLWMTFAELGTGMILFVEERYEASRAVIDAALTTARAHQYTQVVEDARDWVRERCMRALNLVGPTLVATGVAEVLSLVEAVPLGKAQKALRYSAQPDLVRSVHVELSSDHETRHLQWTYGAGWSCTCPLFVETNRCSHVVSVMLRGIAPTVH